MTPPTTILHDNFDNKKLLRLIKPTKPHHSSVENVRVTLSKTPSADEIAPGQALTLTCAAKAGPKPDYLLFKNTTNHIVEYNNAATAGVVVTDNGLSYTHTIARLVSS